MHSKTELKGKHSNFEFEAKLYYENVSKLKYTVCQITGGPDVEYD